MNRRNASLAIITLIALAALTLFQLSKQPNQSNSQTQPTHTPNQTEFSYACQKDKSVLELLEDKADDIKTEDSSYGEFVTSINETPQGNGKYWTFKVDNKEATVGAQQYICQGTEAIKWELK